MGTLFVFQFVIVLFTGFGVDDAHVFAGFEEDPFHADIRFDFDSIVVYEKAIHNGLISGVAIDYFLEKGQCVWCGGGCEADLDGIEILDHLAPDSRLFRRETTMAFIGYNKVECMDGDVQRLRLFLVVRIALVL